MFVQVTAKYVGGVFYETQCRRLILRVCSTFYRVLDKSNLRKCISACVCRAFTYLYWSSSAGHPCRIDL